MNYICLALAIALGIFIGLISFSLTAVGMMVAYAKIIGRKKQKEKKGIPLPDNQEI